MPVGGVALGRVSGCSLHSRLVFGLKMVGKEPEQPKLVKKFREESGLGCYRHQREQLGWPAIPWRLV